MPVYFNGLVLGFTLITSLGPQNIFLIRQGAMRKYAALSAVICFICDVVLVTLSITGIHHILERQPFLRFWMTLAGAGFMLFYGLKTLYSAYHNKPNSLGKGQQVITRWQIVFLALGFSLLNPYAIIDTLLLIGGSSSQYPSHQQAFLLGVLTSSFIWFTTLTIVTHYFANVLKKPNVWRLIEWFSGIVMLILCFKLLGIQFK